MIADSILIINMGFIKPSDIKRKEYQEKRQNLLMSLQRNEIDELEYQKLLFNLDFDWVLNHFSNEDQIILRNFYDKLELPPNLEGIKKKNTVLNTIFNKTQKLSLKQVLSEI